MRIAIGGDIIPTTPNIRLFTTGDVDGLMSEEIKRAWFEADYRIVNLETPLTTTEVAKKKYGRSVKTDPAAVSGLKALNIDIVCLSNNHILDYGIEGLQETVNVLHDNNLSYVGIGSNKQDIEHIYVIKNDTHKIGIYNCGECEFSAATKQQPGGIGFDHYSTIRFISMAKKELDKLFIIYHGGVEFYRYPSPEIQRDCRAMIDAGADAVICQHGHCIACEEYYHNGYINYGHGHFISNLSDNPMLFEEMILFVDFAKDSMHISYMPVQVNEMHTLETMDNAKVKQVLEAYYLRSSELSPDKLDKKYECYVKTVEKGYLFALRGNRLLDRIISRFYCNYKNVIYSDKELRALYDFTNTKVHNEIIRKIYEMREMTDD